MSTPASRRSSRRSVAPSASDSSADLPAPAPVSASASRKRRRASELRESAVDEEGELTNPESTAASDAHDAPESAVPDSSLRTPLAGLRSSLRPTSSFHSSLSSAHSVHQSRGPTPLRISRLNEKAELQDLNSRLELYILKNREREVTQSGATRELTLVKEQHAKAIEELKREFEDRLDALKSQRAQQSSEFGRVSDENRRLQGEVETLRGEVEQLKEEGNLGKRQLQHVTNQLSEAQSKALEFNERASLLDGEKRALEADNSALKSRIELINESMESAMTEAAAATQRLADSQLEMENLSTRSKMEVDRLQKECQELHSVNSRIEDELRREFGMQLKQLLADRQLQFEEEKEAGLKQLKQFYEQKLEVQQSQLQEAIQAKETMEIELNTTIQKHARESAEFERLQLLKEAAERQADAVQQSIEVLRRQHEEELSAKNAHLKELILRLARQEEEFQTLMDVKIGLDLELAQYQKMLETEESRLGIQPVN